MRHKLVDGLHNPPGGPKRFRVGDKINSRPCSQRGRKSVPAHKWAHWLCNPCLPGEVISPIQAFCHHIQYPRVPGSINTFIFPFYPVSRCFFLFFHLYVCAFTWLFNIMCRYHLVCINKFLFLRPKCLICVLLAQAPLESNPPGLLIGESTLKACKGLWQGLHFIGQPFVKG